MIAQYAGDDPQSNTVLTGIRLTPLDPRRPTRGLLEDLLAGIHGWLLHDEYAELDDEDEDLEDDEEDSEAETAERHQHYSRAQFTALVRSIAADNRDRLV